MRILTTEFYTENDVIDLAQMLLGKQLVSFIGGEITSGLIVETEAYRAPEDKASHAYGNKLTNRTKTMFEKGGIAYIYLVYGFHHLFNVVTGKKGVAHAVLIRAIDPVDNIDTMLKRRNKAKSDNNIFNGPGKLTQALGIKTEWNGIDLTKEKSNIQILDTGINYKKSEIIASPRIGIDYAEEWIEKPWRFRIKGNLKIKIKI